MRKGGGKEKGSEFERSVCKKLSMWLTAGEHDDVLWRSAMSGGRATVQHKKDKRSYHQVGDICAVGPAGRWITENFLMECKCYKKIDFEALILKDVGELKRFLQRMDKDLLIKDNHGRAPLFIIRQDRTPTIMITDIDGSQRLMSKSEARSVDCLLCTIPRLDLRVYLFEDFLQEVRPPC